MMMRRTPRSQLRDAEVNWRGRSVYILSMAVGFAILALTVLAGIDVLQTGELSDNTATFLLPIFTGLLGVISGFVASKAAPVVDASGNPVPDPLVEPSAPAAVGVAAVAAVDKECDDDCEDCEDCLDDNVPVDAATGLPLDAEHPTDPVDPGLLGDPGEAEFGDEDADWFDDDDEYVEGEEWDLDDEDEQARA